MPALYTRPGEYEIQKIEAKVDVVPYPSGKPNEWYITLYLTITSKALRDIPSWSAYSIEERGGVRLAGRTLMFVSKYFLSGARADEIKTSTVVTDRYYFNISLPYKTEITIPTFDNLTIPITINPPPTPSVAVLPIPTKWCEKEGKYIPETEWSESRCVPVAVPAPTAIIPPAYAAPVPPTEARPPTIFEQYPLLLPIILIGAVGIGAYFLLKK